MKAILITFESLPVRLLGCYGCEWVETWAFDRLATEAVLFDQHFVEDATRRSSEKAIADSLRRGGVDLQLLREADSEEFGGVPKVTTVRGRDGFDAEPREVPFAQLVATTKELLPEWSSRSDSSLLWLHSRGIPSPCLTPIEYAQVYLDQLDDELNEDEEEVEAETEPDEESDELESEVEPEDIENESVALVPEPELQRILDAVAQCQVTGQRIALAPLEWKIARCVHAGYATLLDRWLGELLDTIREIANDALVIVAGLRGIALRDRPDLLPHRAGLSEDIVHPPLFVRLPQSKAGERRQELVQVSDIVPTLFEWFAESNVESSLLPVVRNETAGGRDELIIQGTHALAIRTRDYYLVVDEKSADPSGRALFLKPEDRWEMNDVVGQYPEQADALAAKLAPELKEVSSPAASPDADAR